MSNQKKEGITTPRRLAEDIDDVNLRPRFLSEFVGQNKIKENLAVYIEAAGGRKESLDHVLLIGPPGLGKTTLAHIISNEMGVKITATSAPVIERAGDLAAILTNLSEFEVLFIDEIHRLHPVIEEILYPAMEDYKIDVMLGQGPSARSVKLSVPSFTLVGATTRAGLLTAPLRNRFGITSRLDFYDWTDLKQITKRSARILKVDLDEDGAEELAKRSRGTPRIVNRLLRRVRDFAQVEADGRIDRAIAISALERLEVDEFGLDEMDRRIIATIIEKHEGGPVGIETIAISVGEEPDTLEELYEPYLIQSGYIKRTPRGRCVTRLAYQHLRISSGKENQLNFLENKRNSR